MLGNGSGLVRGLLGRSIAKSIVRQQTSFRGLSQSAGRVKESSWRKMSTFAAATAGLGLAGFASANYLMPPQETKCEESFFHHHNEKREFPFGPNFIADACESAIPALVNISAMQHGPWGQVVQSAGSGFVIRSDGLIATNAHVVKSAKVLNITLNDGRQYRGKVFASDTMSDLALVLVDEPLDSPLPTMAIGDSSTLRTGEFVIALGSPLNMQNSVTAGIVSSVARGASEIGIPQSRNEYIQTDAAINVGNSGGPLINLRGEVVGINTMKVAGGDGIGFAIPINTAWMVLSQLRDTGKVVRPFLGLRMVGLTRPLIKYEKRQNSSFPDVENGLLVVGVAPNSPATKAGMIPGDVIVSFDGKKVSSVQDIVRAIGYDVGKTYPVTIARANNLHKDIYLTTEALQL